MHLHSPVCVRYVLLLGRLELTLLLLFSDGNNHARLAVLRFRQGQLQVDRGMALTVTTMMFGVAVYWPTAIFTFRCPNHTLASNIPLPSALYRAP